MKAGRPAADRDMSSRGRLPVGLGKVGTLLTLTGTDPSHAAGHQTKRRRTLPASNDGFEPPIGTAAFPPHAAVKKTTVATSVRARFLKLSIPDSPYCSSSCSVVVAAILRLFCGEPAVWKNRARGHDATVRVLRACSLRYRCRTAPYRCRRFPPPLTRRCRQSYSCRASSWREPSRSALIPPTCFRLWSLRR
jgi:hypothetical protein